MRAGALITVCVDCRCCLITEDALIVALAKPTGNALAPKPGSASTAHPIFVASPANNPCSV